MTEGGQALVLAVGDDRYALPMAQVREVVEARVLTRLPEAPGTVLGLINVRGRVIPVLDLGLLLGLGALGSVGGIAVVDSARGNAGLASDALPFRDVVGGDLGASTIQPGARRHRTGDGVATLLDLDALLAPDRIAR